METFHHFVEHTVFGSLYGFWEETEVCQHFQSWWLSKDRSSLFLPGTETKDVFFCLFVLQRLQSRGCCLPFPGQQSFSVCLWVVLKKQGIFPLKSRCFLLSVTSGIVLVHGIAVHVVIKIWMIIWMTFNIHTHKVHSINWFLSWYFNLLNFIHS